MLIGNISIGVGLQTSAFQKNLKDVSKQLKETFNLDSKQAQGLAKLQQSLQKQVETFGLSSRQAQIYTLRQQGVGKAALATAVSLDKQLSTLEKAKARQDELASKGRNVFESTRTSSERYRSGLGELREMLAKGTIDQQTYNRAVKDLAAANPGRLAAFAKGLTAVAVAASAAAIGLGTYLVHVSTIAAVEGRAASKLGITAQSFRELTVAGRLAGVGAEDFAGALETMARGIGEASFSGLGEANVAIERLGFNARALAALAPDRQFRALAEGIRLIPDPAQQAAIAVAIFGEKGRDLLGVLRGGTDGLDAAAKNVKGFSEENVEASAKLNAAVTSIHESFTGLAQGLVIQLAPVVVDIANRFAEWAKTGTNATDLIQRGLGHVTDVTSMLTDAARLLGTVFFGTLSIVSTWFAGAVKGISLLGHGIAAVINLLPGMSAKFNDTLDVMADALEAQAARQFKLAGDLWNNIGKPGPNFRGLGAGVLPGAGGGAGAGAKANTGVLPKTNASDVAANSAALARTNELTNNLRTSTERYAIALKALPKDLPKWLDARARSQLINDTIGVKTINDATVGLGEFEKKSKLIFGLWQTNKLTLQNAREAQYKNLQEFFESRGAGDLGNQIKQWSEELRSPFQKVQEDFSHLLDAHEKGFISDVQLVYSAAKVRDKVFGAETKFAGAQDVFSKEGRSSILQATQGTSKFDAMRDVANIAREQLAVQRAILRANEKADRVLAMDAPF